MAYIENTSQFSATVNPSGYEMGMVPIEKMNYFYEIEPAIVVDTEVDDIVGKVRIYALFSKSFIVAYPLNENFRSFPMPGEILTFRSYRLKKNSTELTNFYEPLSFNHSVHLNDQGFLNLLRTSLEEMRQSGVDIQKVKGVPSNISSSEVYLGKYFKFEKTQDKKSVMFEGDTILEGRSGQSIRFGSAIPKKITFENKYYGNLVNNSSWIYAKNEDKGGNPFIVISNGKVNGNDMLTIESVQNDASTIFLSKGGTNGIDLPFLLSAVKNKPSMASIPSSYNSDLIVVNSGQLILNSKTDSIILSSNSDMIGIANKNIYLKTSNSVELQGSAINLGENAKEVGQSVVKAEDLMRFLDSMITGILSLKYDNYGMLIKGTDSQLTRLQKQLTDLLTKKSNSPVFSSKTTFTL